MVDADITELKSMMRGAHRINTKSGSILMAKQAFSLRIKPGMRFLRAFEDFFVTEIRRIVSLRRIFGFENKRAV